VGDPLHELQAKTNGKKALEGLSENGRRRIKVSNRDQGMLVGLVLFVLVSVLSPATAVGKCGTGNPISYDDVEAVMISQGGGMLRNIGVFRASTFDESKFWALFWSGESTKYSQYDLKGEAGTYHLSATISDARAVLRRDHFYGLSNSGVIVTDTAQQVVSVERCDVVTKIRIFNTGDPDDQSQDRATLRLFDDLRNLVLHARAFRISRKPTTFDATLMFNPEEQILGR
jgi:hypothetical protein